MYRKKTHPPSGRYPLFQIFLVMKLSLLLVLISFFSVSANSLAQSISIVGKKLHFKDVLMQMKEQTDYDFIYRTKDIAEIKSLTLDLRSRSIKEVLDICLKNKPLTYSINNKTVVIKKRANAPSLTGQKAESVQEQQIQGLILDETGQPILGATVQLIKGQNRSTLTDAEGAFVLKTEGFPNVIRISAVGFEKQELIVADGNRITIHLKSSVNDLEEVVVMAYGQKQRKLSVTGSVSSIQTKELKQSPVANLTNALAGRMPGLITAQRSGRPGSDGASLYIRGISTYAGSTSPLVVIDGLPRGDANFGDIDPNEIESVSILKDASSTALYGIQGANGIILITTKRGQESAPKISANLQYAVQEPSRRTRFLDSYTSAQLQNEAAANDHVDPIYTPQQLEYYKIQSKPALYPNVDWYGEMIKKYTPQKQANVNISGGTKFVRYFVSGSYLRQEPNYKHADANVYGVKYKYDRYNFRSNIDINLTPALDIQLDLASRLENRTGPINDHGDNNFFMILLSQIGNGVTPIFNPDGSIAMGSLPNEYGNPYAIITQNGYFDDFWNSTNGNVAVTRKLDFITKGLKVRGLFSFENYGNIAFSQNQEYDSFRYTENLETGAPIYTRYSTKNNVSKSGGASGQRYYYYDLKFLYDRTFGQNHHVDGIFLFNRYYRSQLGDLPKVYEGFVLHTAYNYKSKYFVEFNAGYNGSENFPPGKRYGFFPALSGAWVISNEDFYSKESKVNLLKLRFSHGYVGNDQIGGANRWLFISDYRPSGGYVFGNTPNWRDGYIENRVGNSEITWEKAAKTNLGIETAFFKNSIKLNVDIFNETRSNILTSALTIPDYLGITASINRNRGKVQNRGIEAELLTNHNLGPIRAFSRLLYTYTKNKILDMDEPVLKYGHQSSVGLPIGYALGYEAMGLFQTKEEIANSPKQSFSSALIPGDIRYRDINGDERIDEADRVMIPTLNIPTNVLGLTLGLGYKNFDISVLLQGAMGGKQIYSAQLTQAFRLGFRPHHLDRWTPENAANAKFPALHVQESNAANNAVTSSYWVRNTDYLKIKNIEIGYELPKDLVKRIALKNIRIYFTGMNLFSWDHVSDLGVDPEINNSGRYGWQPYPIQKVYNLGLSTSF